MYETKKVQNNESMKQRKYIWDLAIIQVAGKIDAGEYNVTKIQCQKNAKDVQSRRVIIF